MLKVPVTERDHLQGDADAAVILVEYGDYECPHCGHAYPIVKRVQKHFGKSLGFVFRNFPLSEIHVHAEQTAEAAEYAAVQGKFWEMHDAIFERKAALNAPLLLEMAEGLGLSAQGLDGALKAKEFAKRVREDFMSGVRSGVNGTPTFFINGQRHDGAFEYEDLVGAIEGRLNQ